MEPITASKPKLVLQSIHFYTGHVMLDYGDNRKFQICKYCKDGKHLKALFNQFCSGIPQEQLTEEIAIHLESRLFHILARGITRCAASHQIADFGEYAEGYCAAKARIAARQLEHEAKENI